MVNTLKELEARLQFQQGRRPLIVYGNSGGGGGSKYANLQPARFFDSQGGSTPWYGSTQFNSFYDSVGNKTYIAYEEIFLAPLKRFIRIRTFDHTTKQWSRSYNVGAESALTNDDHGVPSIAMNFDGRIVCCWGNHDGDFHLSVSTNIRDISSWSAATDLVGAYAYPHLVLLPSNAMICLLRKNFAPGTGGFAAGAKVFVYHSLTFAGAVVTDAGEITIGDMGNDSRWYQGDAILLPSGRIAQACTRADFGDTVRLNVYYYEIDITNLRLQSFTGTTVAFPVTNTDMTNTFKVYSTTGGNTSNTPGFTIDANGRVHFVTTDGTTSDGGGSNESAQDVVYFIGNAGVIGTPVIVGATTQRYNGYDIIPYTDGSVSLMWSKDQFGGSTQRGGSIMHRKLGPNQPATAFGIETTMMKQDLTRFALDTPAAVFKGIPELQVFWFERALNSNDAGNYGKRMYGWGQTTGLIRNSKPSLVIPSALTGDGFWLDLSVLDRIFSDAGVTKANIGDQVIQVNDRFGTGNVLTGVGGTAPFLDIYGEQYCLKFTGSSAGTRFLTSAAKQWSAGPGFMCTGVFRHWMPSTASLSLISLDAGAGNARVCQPINVNGKEIRATAFNGATQTLLTGGVGASPYVNDYIVQAYTTGNGLNLVLAINGVVVAGPTVITGGAINTTSVIMRVGASAVAAATQFFMGICTGMVFRSGEQTISMRDNDYQWGLSQLPL